MKTESEIREYRDALHFTLEHPPDCRCEVCSDPVKKERAEAALFGAAEALTWALGDGQYLLNKFVADTGCTYEHGVEIVIGEAAKGRA